MPPYPVLCICITQTANCMLVCCMYMTVLRTENVSAVVGGGELVHECVARIRALHIHVVPCVLHCVTGVTDRDYSAT